MTYLKGFNGSLFSVWSRLKLTKVKLGAFLYVVPL
jgi:hypothetical protein